jgi:hypothetical protein
VQLARKALACRCATTKASFTAMAETWRNLAVEAVMLARFAAR